MRRRRAEREARAWRAERARLPALLLLGLALAAGCVSAGGEGGRLPIYLEPIKQITLRAGRFGWGALVVGMSFRDAELALGERFSASPRSDSRCGYVTADVAMRRQGLRLEFEGSTDSAHLRALWLRLENPRGEVSVMDVVEVLKRRFPSLRYVPDPHDPKLPESLNPRPLYGLGDGQPPVVQVDPRLGIHLGDLCLDTPAREG
jgi:hypothetical protein